MIKQSVPIHPATTNLLSVPMDLSTVNLCTASPLGPTHGLRLFLTILSSCLPFHRWQNDFLPPPVLPHLYLSLVQWVSRVRLFATDPMDCSTPDFPALHQLPELVQTHVRVGDAIHPSHPVFPFSSCLQSFPVSGSF